MKFYKFFFRFRFLGQNKLYGCEVSRADHLKRREGGGFDAKEYDEYPERYISTFSRKIAPFASVIVNGIYWAVGSPKLISIPDAKNLLRPANTPWLPTSKGSPALPHRMLAICDISADPGGSIEFMNECTTIDTPFCLYDADRNKDTKSFKGPGVLVCSIDNMPTQLPREATDMFGELLTPFVSDIVKSDAKRSLEEEQFCFPIKSVRESDYYKGLQRIFFTKTFTPSSGDYCQQWQINRKF